MLLQNFFLKTFVKHLHHHSNLPYHFHNKPLKIYANCFSLHKMYSIFINIFHLQSEIILSPPEESSKSLSNSEGLPLRGMSSMSKLPFLNFVNHFLAVDSPMTPSLYTMQMSWAASAAF